MKKTSEYAQVSEADW